MYIYNYIKKIRFVNGALVQECDHVKTPITSSGYNQLFYMQLFIFLGDRSLNYRYYHIVIIFRIGMFFEFKVERHSIRKDFLNECKKNYQEG